MHRNRIHVKRKSETNRCDFLLAEMEFQIIINFARIEYGSVYILYVCVMLGE